MSAHKVADRESIAGRLLTSSAKASYDPLVEVDWDAPIEDRHGLVPHRSSLYGTYLWDRLTEEQRRELTRHEFASFASIGIWFEAILIQMLIRHAFDRDPSTNHVQYAYTEIADECRHSVMFAKVIDKLGAAYYGPPRGTHLLGKLLKTVSTGPVTFSAALYIEELLDQLQREAMATDSLEPVIRAVCRVHVVEEARHMRYAREEFLRVWQRTGRLGRGWTRLALGLSVYFGTTRAISPKVYEAVGLDPKEAARVARENPHWRRSLTWAARRVVATLEPAGAISGLARRLWRRAGVLEPAA